jgi:uncharacterized lipoprotein YddW (UPF0748 family)
MKNPLLLFAIFAAFNLPPVVAQQSAPSDSTPRAREFRAAWIATVDNIDWPNKGTTDPATQRAEYVKLLDMHVANGLNAVIVQVRPAADAFYPSPYEPWSEWLTGKQGQPPVPWYDPLAFMIAEAHRRKLEFHAWLNPYRAMFNRFTSKPSATHITRLFPSWFLDYGDQKFFDPGNKGAQQYVGKIVQDIVARYDVDAIHFDDYFYPYRIAGKEFPDETSFQQYGSGMTRDDWRRSNVDSIILLLAQTIKAQKPWVKFGISPFGVWRNSNRDSTGSNTRAGQTNYDDLYADIVLWLKKGWIDYVAPQLYWEFGHKAADFETLLAWWSNNSYGKHCYIGLGLYKAGTSAPWRNKNQLPRMIQAIRNTPNIQGQIFFSSKSFVRNPNGWCDSLRLHYYAIPADVPAMPWLGKGVVNSE